MLSGLEVGGNHSFRAPRRGRRGRTSKARAGPRTSAGPHVSPQKPVGRGKSKRLNSLSTRAAVSCFLNSSALPLVLLPPKKARFSHLGQLVSPTICLSVMWVVSSPCRSFPTHLQTERAHPAGSTLLSHLGVRDLLRHQGASVAWRATVPPGPRGGGTAWGQEPGTEQGAWSTRSRLRSSRAAPWFGRRGRRDGGIRHGGPQTPAPHAACASVSWSLFQPPDQSRQALEWLF